MLFNFYTVCRYNCHLFISTLLIYKGNDFHNQYDTIKTLVVEENP